MHLPYSRICRLGILPFLAIIALAGPSQQLSEVAGQRWVARFSEMQPGSALQAWRPHEFPRIHKHTVYSLASNDGVTVLKAESKASASALATPLNLDPRAFPYLEWRWKVEGVVAPEKWVGKKSDDYAARLFVIFEKKAGPFSFLSGLMRRMAGGLPGRALNYVWAGSPADSEPTRSPYTKQVAMIALQEGDSKVGTWIVERRNVLEDFRTAFGREPGRIIGIAVMSDTDNTKTECVAYYGDIRLLPAAAGLERNSE